MSDHAITSAAVIGTGMMGPGIAVSLALRGVRATLISRAADGAAAGLEKARGLVAVLEDNGLASAERAAVARDALAASADLDAAVAAADFVVESGPEDLRFKQDLFARMDEVAKPEAILATNTSGLSINEVVERCRRPERALTAHFWNPPHLMKLVELVPNERTSPDVLAATQALLEACGKVVVRVRKDRPGQLGNRLQHAMVREAIHIVAEGIASAEDVDRAAKAGFGLRLPVYGVFEHQDGVGLDLVLAIQDYVSKDLARSTEAHPDLKRRVAAGELGVKSGKGYHDWKRKSWDEVRDRRDRFLLHFLKSEFGREAGD